jgi:two-component system, chemotaxis family, chemotaxis protein CheY
MEQLPSDNGCGSFTCLVADDSLFARKNIGKIVSRIGGRMIGEAVNGLEAVKLYNQLKPDLVLLDVTMPELDGIEALRKIMENDNGAKVIMVTSLGHKEMIWKALRLGAKHLLNKPYAPDHATMIIKWVLEDRKEAMNAT